MKKCYTCNIFKEEIDFNKNKCRADGLGSICRECGKVRSKRYYQENLEKHRQVTAKRKNRLIKEVQKKLIEYLEKNPCVSCGENDILTLDFDHIHNKEKEICYVVGSGWCWDRVEKEINKCQVLCANCHRKKTHKENNSYKWKYKRACNSEAE